MTGEIVGFSPISVIDDGEHDLKGGAVLIHQTSLLGCVDPKSKVVAPVGIVVEQTQYDLDGPRLVGRVAHSNNHSTNPRSPVARST